MGTMAQAPVLLHLLRHQISGWVVDVYPTLSSLFRLFLNHRISRQKPQGLTNIYFFFLFQFLMFMKFHFQHELLIADGFMEESDDWFFFLFLAGKSRQAWG